MGQGHSRKRVSKAGERLRAHRLGHAPLDVDSYDDELAVVVAFRAGHRDPLRQIAANLRYYVGEQADGQPWDVAQRLKAMPTILDKLTRHPEMALARMHDIGGCRGILPTQEAVDRVIERLLAQRRWEIRDHLYDYVSNPKPDGYRAKHLVVVKNGVLIEVQLRTRAQHRFAELVERFDRTYRLHIKTGRAEPEMRNLFALVSDLLRVQESGEIADDVFADRLALLAKRIGNH